MKNNLIVMNGEFGAVRTMVMNNEVWFVGKDVAECLGYSNTRDALSTHVDEDDKADVAIHDGRQNRNMIIINESGLYSLVLSSKLDNAKKFKRWITSEVLPSIRKNGMYATENTIEMMLDNPDFAISLLTKLKEEREEKKRLQNKIKEDKPKVEYHDEVLQPSKLITITQIAKDLGMSAVKLNEILHDLHIQYKKSKSWCLYSEYEHLVPSHFDYHITKYGQVLKATELGRKWIIDILKSKGKINK